MDVESTNNVLIGAEQVSTQDNKLYFKNATLRSVAEGLTLQFHCPVCSLKPEALADDSKATWFDSVAILDDAKTFPYDFNKEATFQIPTHNDLTAKTITSCAGNDAVIRLYVAVHQETEKDAPSVCVSVEPVKPDWWRRMAKT